MNHSSLEWNQTTFGRFISIKRGYDLTSQERRAGDIPVYGAAGHNGFHDEVKAIAPGIVIGRSGGSFGQAHFVSKDFWPHNTAMYVTDFKGNDPDFVYYLLKILDFSSLNSGSAQPSLNRNFLYPIRISVPKTKEQKSIGRALKQIDKKIALNNKINTELEAMAKLIYDYWFVQFDFPDANGKPYKSSGGKMVYNEALKREIPERWGVGNIMQLTQLLGGGTPKTTMASFWGGSIPFFTPADASSGVFSLETKQNVTTEGLKSCSSKLFKKGTIFVTARGTVGKINIASCDMAMNQSCYALQGKEGVGSTFIYFYANELIQYVKSKASGSIFKALVTNDFKFTELVIPPVEVIARFSNTVDANFNKLLLNGLENRELTKLRDWLLPMLMNGQVTVKDTAS